ncbi:MAG TPA: hypothetical protein VGP72_27020 [Planctomycetota bacterium]|jgi:hypothetical protein
MRITCSKRTAVEVEVWIKAYVAHTGKPEREVFDAIAQGLQGENKEHGHENRIYEDFPARLRIMTGIDDAFETWGGELGMSFCERMVYELRRK